MTLKVIGAGFGRTGTASLKIALEKLLNGPCYHMSEVLGVAGHVDYWLDVADGKPNWDAIFGSYVATVDFPAANYWRELADAYPKAKVVLSVRNPENWFASTQDTIFSPALSEIAGGTKWADMVSATIMQHLNGAPDDNEAMIAAFNTHNAAVEAAFGRDRLLVFRAKDGWDPLCKFLGVSVPDEPYPHVNSKDEFQGMLGLLKSPLGARAMNGEGIDMHSVHDVLKGD